MKFQISDFRFQICATLCAVLSGCAGIKRDAAAVDRDYRTRVKSFSIPTGITLSDAGIVQIGFTPTWTYRQPSAVSSPAPGGKQAASPTVSTRTISTK